MFTKFFLLLNGGILFELLQFVNKVLVYFSLIQRIDEVLFMLIDSSFYTCFYPEITAGCVSFQLTI